MKINQKDSILENIVSTDISVEVLGTSDLTEEQELELLHNFTRTIEFNKIQFKANMKIDDGNKPIVTVEEADKESVVEITITDLINKQYPVDENLHITFSIDSTKIPDSELNEVMDTKEKMAQAKVVLFAEKIREAISEKLIEIRGLSNKFEGETSYTL